ncbi:MAG: nucleoside deaminase [Chlamydiales bacterium]
MFCDDEKNHTLYMSEALHEAHLAFSAEEVPVGAVIVYNGVIIARDHNRVEEKKDCTAHAEILCMRQAMQVIGDWRLTGATLYTTLEPCSMCAGAIVLARIPRIVWGAPDIRYGASGTRINLFSTLDSVHKVHVVKGICGIESSKLLKNFFYNKRIN